MRISELSDGNIGKLRLEVKELMSRHLGNMKLLNYWKDIAMEIDDDRCRRAKDKGSIEQ